uniref:Protein inturned n=1 Tax=Graphocephala atropunctata TaxID=36148 RepID=A0A1B6LS24_9HEMI
MMSDCGEQQSLLQKDVPVRDVQRKRNNYDRHNLFNADLYSDEERWDDSDSSSCCSYYSDCHSSSSAVEWETEVTPEGELFYIESFIQPKHHQKQLMVQDNQASKDEEVQHKDDEKRKVTTKGKLVRLIRRRSSRRSTRKKTTENVVQDDSEANSRSGNKVTFRESQEGECREVILSVLQEDSNLGRRATPAENLLGLVLSTFSDKTRIMVASFIPNSQASKKRNIKVGDWLKSINGEEISNETINLVLNKIIPPCEVILKLQRVAECDVTQPTLSQDLHNKVTITQSDLVKQIVSGSCDLERLLCWVVYITQEGLTESGPADQGLLYHFPHQDNVLSAARGTFVTINHLLPELTTSSPISTSITYQGQLIHIIYTSENNELLLLALPASRFTLKEAILLNNEVILYLRFTYQTLSRCFTNKENHCALDRIFYLVQTLYLSSSDISLQRFEDLLPAAHLIALPRDAQVQIDDALSELESNDFGGYNDDEDCQRLYSIIGSCLFYKGYLLASHMTREDLMDTNAFCRHNGLLSLSRAESVRNVVVWKEVYPASCNRGLPTLTLTYFLPQGRWFLLLVGQEESLLAVLLESGGCTVKIEGNPGPEPIFVKQAQATLQHMKEIEVLSLAEKWIQNECRLQTVCPDSPCKSPPRDLSVNTSGPPDFSPKSTPSPGANKKSQEVTSILKHRVSPDDSTLNSGHYETSEDSTSQAASSVVSDEAAPILGRRAERERDRLSDSDFSDDSDWAPFKDQGGFGSRLFDLSDLGKNLLSDIEYSLPMRLTAGDQNTLFYYVHLDCTDGVLLCSPTNSSSGRLKLVLDNFRMMAPMIHDLLQNTVRFKKLKVQEVSECLINKTLIANKEHAMLFECPPVKNESSKKATPLTYWVVGRLFFMPQPREVYICYQDLSPQNLVEIAFRLALSASG